MVEANGATVEQIQNALSDESVANEPLFVDDADLHVVVADDDVGAFFREVRKVGAETETHRSGDKIRGYVTLPEE